MERLELKKKVFEEVRHRHEIVIKDLREALENSQESITMEDDDVGIGNLLDTAKETVAEDVDRIARQLTIANEQMMVLDKLITSEVHEQAMIGSLVITNVHNFFIAISIIDKIHVDGKAFIGISTEAPISRALIGRKKGDQFEFNGNKYLIEELC